MLNNKIFDVAIVGGGMAGLSLAIQCNAAGFSVVLFEKEQYPYHKVCGEYISLESWNFLESLGLNLNSLNLPFIKKLNISDLNGNLAEIDLPLGGFGISRFKVDEIMYQLALNKGVVIYTKTKVEEVDFIDDQFNIFSGSNVPIAARVVAGSYGRKGNLDVKWKRSFTLNKPGKLNNYVGVKYHIKYPIKDDVIELHNFQDGYCGISKIEEGKCCLCYLTTARNLKKNNNSINEMEREIVMKNPFLKEIFSTGVFLFNEPVVVSQVSFEKKSQVENHVLMLGDTAGVVAPLSGNGMSMALHSGKIAFLTIKAFLLNEITRTEMELQYRRQWKINFSKRLFVGRLLQKISGREKHTARFVSFVKAFPKLAKKLISGTHGKAF